MKENYRINCVFDVTIDDFKTYVGRAPKDDNELKGFARAVGDKAHDCIDDNLDEVIGEVAEEYEQEEDDVDEEDDIEEEDEYK